MIDFELTAEQRMLVDTIARFVDGTVAPRAVQWERAGALPDEVIGELGTMGLLGITVPAEDDGAGLGTVELALALDGLARGSAALALVALGHNLVGSCVARYGSAAQRRSWLAKLARGDALATTSLPLASLDAVELQGDAARGESAPMARAAHAELALITARTAGSGTATLLLVERPALSAVAPSDSLGAVPAALARARVEVASVVASRLPPAALEAMRTLGRIGIAAIANGLAAAALDEARRYAGERRQFGQPIAEFQATQWKLANAATELAAARGLTSAAALAYPAAARQALAAQLFSAEAARRAADDALQIHGGIGYTREVAVERIYRDVEICGLAIDDPREQRVALARYVSEGA